MQNKISLLADGGSTKCLWRVDGLTDSPSWITTRGINPLMTDEGDLITWLHDGVKKQLSGRQVEQIAYYGAGCRAQGTERMVAALRAVFPEAQKVTVDSDLAGAARALLGEDGNGVACILGTGSNSGLFLDGKLVESTPALGYILGDEGSGAVLGHRLLGDVLKRQLSPAVCALFVEEYALTPDQAIEHVYRGEQPNRYLASFVPFLAKYRERYTELQDLVTEEFRRFFQRNVAAYGHRELGVGFVGGVAYTFQNELKAVAQAEHFRLTRILLQPLA